MDEDLGVPINSLCKFLISHLCVINVDLVRDNKTRLCFSSNNQVPQVAIVGLHVALTSAYGQALQQS